MFVGFSVVHDFESLFNVDVISRNFAAQYTDCPKFRINRVILFCHHCLLIIFVEDFNCLDPYIHLITDLEVSGHKSCLQYSQMDIVMAAQDCDLFSDNF